MQAYYVHCEVDLNPYIIDSKLSQFTAPLVPQQFFTAPLGQKKNLTLSFH